MFRASSQLEEPLPFPHHSFNLSCYPREPSMRFHLFLFNSTFSKQGNKQELQKFLTTFHSEQEAIEKLVVKKKQQNNSKTTV